MDNVMDYASPNRALHSRDFRVSWGRCLWELPSDNEYDDSELPSIEELLFFSSSGTSSVS